jgi:glycosyltransferase involved in cell wall biosynthesis
MRVLFVVSGHKGKNQISPFIKSQGDSLRAQGVDVSYFPIEGKGLKAYLRGVGLLRNYLRKKPADLIHAHYSLCGWVAVLARSGKPIVLSLMGDDAYGEFIGANKVAWSSRWLTASTWLIQPFVNVLISKSTNIERYVYRKRISHIIPNGVCLEHFDALPGGRRETIGLRADKKYILFLGDKKEARKNYALAQAAVMRLHRPEVELIAPFPIGHDKVVEYLNAADVFVLCSFMEGSPNALKEAMACNCPLVATNVGDAGWVIGNTPGCYVASFDPADFSNKLAGALAFAETQGRTKGRERLLELGLSAEDVARRLIDIYAHLLNPESQIA